jgi:hypothetical protein
MKSHKSEETVPQSVMRQLRPHRTTSSLHQMYVSTRSVVQDFGYSFRNLFFDQTILVDGDIKVWICGKFFESSKPFYKIWNALARMTYRRNWPDPFISPRTGIVFDSDTGWGCTVRCAQMLLAKVCEDKSVSLFSDEKNSVFGIHAFLAKAPNLCADWAGPTSISLIVRDLVGSNRPSLGTVLSTDGFIPLEEIVHASSFEEFSSSPSLEASPRSAGGFVDVGLLVPTVRSTDMGEEVWFIDEQENCCPTPPRRETRVDDLKTPVLEKLIIFWQRPVLITVAIRLTPDDNLPHSLIRPLLAYMTLPSFAGMLGGPDRRCHYIVGFITELLEDEDQPVTSFLAIDPHVVQEAVGLSTDASVAFANSIHPSRISPESICPTISLSFVVRSESELDLLKSQLEEIKNSCPESFCVVGSNHQSTRQKSLDQIVVLENSF